MTAEVFPREELTTERLRLRPFTVADAEDVHALWHDDRFVATAPPGYRHAYASLETAIEWCTTGTESRWESGTTIEFAAEPLEGGRLIGHVALFGANRTTGTAEIHYWTATRARGKGYATEAARAVAEWALRDGGMAGSCSWPQWTTRPPARSPSRRGSSRRASCEAPPSDATAPARTWPSTA